MRLDNKIKSATLDTALRILLKDCSRSPDRCARNILELGCALADCSLTDVDTALRLSQLRRLLSENRTDLVKPWLMETFHLFL